MISDLVQIHISITTPAGKVLGLQYAIGRDQAEILYPGRPPVFESHFEIFEWQQRSERAVAMSKHIAADLAHRIVQACSPDWQQENTHE